ncbi:MAG: hypothetical protein RIQ81_2279 [Pseudomonadota bacterium]
MAELELIEWIKSRINSEAAKAGGPVILGPGDDAGVVKLAPTTVAAADMLLDGVHFDLHTTPPGLAGRKALAVNLSDLAAMGAVPVCALVSVALPQDGAPSLGRDIMTGILELAQECGVAILGGDTNSWHGKTVIAVTVLGQPLPGKELLLRSGAQPGDWLLVTGALGGSLGPERRGRHLTFSPRLEEAATLHLNFALTSMIDVSDGVATDARHLAKESNVSVWLERNSIPVSSDVAYSNGEDRVMRALCDGEDFELLFTAAPDTARKILQAQPLGGVAVTRIGEVRAGAPGLFWMDGQPVEARGYEHGTVDGR